MNNVFLFRLRRLCAFLIGVVFLLAGIFKLLDPVGAGLVMEGYFRFFHVTFLLPTAKATAVVLALAEAILGAAMISGVWRKQVAIITTAMIAFFTVLTLFLAIFNPVSLTDCGCFGEVIHLTNFQTFLKNLILLALAMVAFLPFKHFGKNRKRKYVSFGIVSASIILFAVYSLTTIPLVDYTEFTPGSELLASAGDDYEDASGNPQTISKDFSVSAEEMNMDDFNYDPSMDDTQPEQTGMPVWAWVLIGVCGAVVVIVVIVVVVRKRKKAKALAALEAEDSDEDL